MPKRSTTKKKNAGGAKKHLGRKTVRSSNRKRAALAGEADRVLPGKRPKRKPSVIQTDSSQEVYGVLLSERRRMGEDPPAVPEEKTKSTASKEPRSVPKTGIAKTRKLT